MNHAQVLRKSFNFLFMLIFLGIDLSAKTPETKKNSGNHANSILTSRAAGCFPTTAKTDLDINNVRTTIMVGGDMFWDLDNAQYEVPKGSGKTSIFLGALWIGGLDPGGNLKLAAMTYRQGGNDFWAGPINQITADVNPATCFKYDRHWKLNRNEVLQWKSGLLPVMPEAVRTWPGNGDAANNEAQFLAPFFDADGNGIYDPAKGDYPYFDFQGNISCKSCGDPAYKDVLMGDQSIWWVFNDVGNIHKQSEAPAIGLEVQAQAFAYVSNDEINDMTFYKYKFINRSSASLNETYMGMYIDSDLGKFDDNYVGCDVSRGMGFSYNGDEDDDGVTGYGLNPPAVGADFVQGLMADANDGIDNNRNGIIDEACEEISMSMFRSAFKDFSIQGFPSTALQYYGYLKGLWKDNSPMTYGGTAWGGPLPTKFMFPGDSDPIGWGIGGTPAVPNPQPPWSEDSEGNTPGNRRFLMSAGPFTLQPGGVNYVTTAVIWARASSGGVAASVEKLKRASDKIQALFDNCFKTIEGPKTPTLAIRELNKELILSITNTKETESFNVLDPTIPTNYPEEKRKYKFQGYQIFQLANANISKEEIASRNPDKVRLVAQVDIKDGVKKLVNTVFDTSILSNVPQEMVNGEDKGILHAFIVTKDLFALGDNALINHKKYYYSLVAYAHNNFKSFDPNDPNAMDGQKLPYLASTGWATYSGIPHQTQMNNGGQNLNALFGSGPQVRRIEGQGNMDQVLDLTDDAVNMILSGYPHKVDKPLYQAGRGPLNVRVYDPVLVPSSEFEMKFTGVSDSSRWTLKNITTGEVRTADTTLSVSNEQLFTKWGLAIKIGKIAEPGQPGAENNGFLEATKTYADASKPWLSAIADQEGLAIENWIRSGISGQIPADYPGIDDEQVYEKVLGGTWAPYRLVSKEPFGAKWPASADQLNQLDKINSVDVIFTADKSKWTRSAVIEMSEDVFLAQGSAKRFDPRKGLSVDKEGNTEGTGTGMSWFPGYAINVSTGERLNIMFGENSGLVSENGRDMIWNPTANRRGVQGDTLFGGMHFLYVMATRYDSCAYFKTQLDLLSTNGKRNVYKEAMWVTIPIKTATQNLLATDVKIRLRVADNYAKYATSSAPVNGDNPMYNFSMKNLSPTLNDVEIAKSALDEIRVVPNPYYAYSGYENNATDSRVKISNLPAKCVISIYTVNGVLVNRFQRNSLADNSSGVNINLDFNLDNSLEWDLKNKTGAKIASGIYLIHIKAEGLGEKTIKWLGVMRGEELEKM